MKDRLRSQRFSDGMKQVGPMRMCIACRKKNESSKMIRFVRQKDGEVVYDKLRQKPGRGANICREKRCFESAFVKKAFKRAFKREILMDKKSLETAVF